jgi:UDP-galactopyranose mutase
MYDYLIVGSGLFGSIFAYEAKKHGKRCLVVECRDHIGGNVYTKPIENIQVHVYGAHVFYTDNLSVWQYIQQFDDFNHFTNAPLANYHGRLFNLPFNMNTFNQLWGTTTPNEAMARILHQRAESGIAQPANLEEYAIKSVGTDIYNMFIKGYSEKQWGKKATELPVSIMRRIPIRYTFDNNYYNVAYQGVPKHGYTYIIEKMLEGCDVQTGVDYLEHRTELDALARRVLYTGAIDRYFEYACGDLEYRSLRFDTVVYDEANFQGNAVINYTDAETPYTRVIEHKHFTFGEQPKTVISYEYPLAYQPGLEPFYPINDPHNTEVYAHYRALADALPNVMFGGRLGTYQYTNMQDTVLNALALCRTEFH